MPDGTYMIMHLGCGYPNTDGDYVVDCTNGTTPTDAVAAKDVRAVEADPSDAVCNQFNVSVMFSDSLEGPWSGESGVSITPRLHRFRSPHLPPPPLTASAPFSHRPPTAPASFAYRIDTGVLVRRRRPERQLVCTGGRSSVLEPCGARTGQRHAPVRVPRRLSRRRRLQYFG